jgi:hypothetical protein
MQDQPKTIAYRESSFYKDGTGSRTPVEGTVPRGYLRSDHELYFGKKTSTPLGSLLRSHRLKRKRRHATARLMSIPSPSRLPE